MDNVPNCDFPVYEPQEDSFLLVEQVKQFVRKDMRVLDMGTGSGIQAIAAAKQGARVTAVDINIQALNYVKTEAEQQSAKITFLESDLFQNVSEKFDCIIFNAPYLPDDERDPDIALDGGQEGYELINRFLKESKTHLAPNGFILLLFSSFSKKDVIDNELARLNYLFTQVAHQHIFFEDLYVYRIILDD